MLLHVPAHSNVEELTPIIGDDAARVAAGSTAWFVLSVGLGWFVFMPFTLWAALGAPLTVSIIAIAAVIGACCAGIWASVLSHRAGELASAHASAQSGHRVRVAAQVARKVRWQRAIERGE